MNKWQLGSPPANHKEYELTLYNGEIRRAKIHPTLDAYNLFYTDCKNPLQNAYCPRSNIFMHRELT